MKIIASMKIVMGAGLIAASGLATATPAEAQRWDRDGYGRGGYDRGHDRDYRDDRRGRHWNRGDRWDRGDRWHRGNARWDRGSRWGGRDYRRGRTVCRYDRTRHGPVRNCYQVYR